MNEELIEQLKAAGFVKKEPNGTFSFDFNYVPTLSELIEACANNSFELLLQDGKWSAILDPELIGVDDDLPEGVGKTPEEAVAKLWLALHK